MTVFAQTFGQGSSAVDRDCPDRRRRDVALPGEAEHPDVLPGELERRQERGDRGRRPSRRLASPDVRPAACQRASRRLRSFAGRFVQLQRRTAAGRWVTIKRLRLNSRSAALFRPVTFRAPFPAARSTLRIAMSVNQAGAGYLAGFSRTIALPPTRHSRLGRMADVPMPAGPRSRADRPCAALPAREPAVPDALAEDRRARADEHAWLLARLVWPASRLGDLDGEDARALRPARRAVRRRPARRRRSRHAGRPGSTGSRARRTSSCRWGTSSRRRSPRSPSAGCVRRCAAAAPKSRRARSSAASSRACRDAGVPFKATAGLHHPLAAEGRHGFLNVLAACAFEDEEALEGTVALTPDGAPLGEPRGRCRGAGARPPRAARRGRQLLVLRARRRAEGARDPVIQGFGTFTQRRRRASARLPLRRRRRRPRRGRRSTRSCRRAGRRGSARPRKL